MHACLYARSQGWEQGRQGSALPDKGTIPWHLSKGSRTGPVTVNRVSQIIWHVCSNEEVQGCQAGKLSQGQGPDQQGAWPGGGLAARPGHQGQKPQLKSSFQVKQGAPLRPLDPPLTALIKARKLHPVSEALHPKATEALRSLLRVLTVYAHTHVHTHRIDAFICRKSGDLYKTQ